MRWRKAHARLVRASILNACLSWCRKTSQRSRTTRSIKRRRLQRLKISPTMMQSSSGWARDLDVWRLRWPNFSTRRAVFGCAANCMEKSAEQLYLYCYPTRWPRDYTLFDHYESFAFRNGDSWPRLWARRTDDTRRDYWRIALWRNDDCRRGWIAAADRERASGRQVSRTENRRDRK